MESALPNYYEQNYPDYVAQNPERKLVLYRRIVEEFVDPSLPRRIHDVGCAFGLFLNKMGDAWELYGTDINEEGIQSARKRNPNGQFRVCGADQRSPFQEKFSVVTSFDCLEHVAEVRCAIENIHAQLLPNGIFVFVVPVYDGISGPIISKLDKDPTHLHKWPRKNWLELVENRFEMIHWTGIVRYLLPLQYYLHFDSYGFRSHTPAILAVFQKRG